MLQGDTGENLSNPMLANSQDPEAKGTTRMPGGYEEPAQSMVDNSSITELPSFIPANPFNQFKWGENDGERITVDINSIYTQIVHGKHNIFKVPSGKNGKTFVQELAPLFYAYGEASILEGIALKAAMIFPALLAEAL